MTIEDIVKFAELTNASIRMITDDKIKDVKKMLSVGVPEGEIKEDLIKEGYSKNDIDKIFKPHHYNMRSWYLTFAIVLLFVGLWLFSSRRSLLGLVFSALLFLQYYREVQRLRNAKNSN